MKYINQINFLLLIAALIFSIYVFSQTFLKETPAELRPEVAGAAQPALENQDLSGSGPTGPAIEGSPSGARPSTSGNARQAPEDSLRQNPLRSRRPPLGTTRPSPPSRRRPTFPSGSVIPDDQVESSTRVPSSAVNPDAEGDDSSAAPPRRITRPPQPRGTQDRAPLPLSQRGAAKREADPDAPSPRGSRQ